MTTRRFNQQQKPGSRRQQLGWWSSIALTAISGLVAIVVLLPAVGSGPAAKTSQCRNNLKLIAMALESYHADYGSFPPAYVADESGNPLYSWRVLVLPYLDQTPMYRRFDLSAPWDAPKNQDLSNTALDIFRCPSNPSEQSPGTVTNYLAVTGSMTAWRGSEVMCKADLGADLSSTILLVEVADSQIPWAKPEDLAFSKMAEGINTSDSNGISSLHCRDWTYAYKNGKPGANVLFADGHTRYFPATYEPEKLSEMLTIPGQSDD